jgi:WhiB family transcriptional regulator, redox-sensing transcriptional regulator
MSAHEPRAIEAVWRLNRVRCAPGSVLVDIVQRDGMCMRIVADAEPAWLGKAMTDQELAALLCTDCTVQDECLELEFRTAGPDTVGVWGALPEEERRALYLRWLQHAEDGGELR